VNKTVIIFKFTGELHANKLHNKPKGCGASEASADGPHSNQSIMPIKINIWDVKADTQTHILG